MSLLFNNDTKMLNIHVKDILHRNIFVSLLIFLVVFSRLLNAQTDYRLEWENHFSGEVSIYSSPKFSSYPLDSNILVCGYQRNLINLDIDCRRYNSNGELGWRFYFNSPLMNADYLQKILIDLEGNTYLIINSITWTVNPNQGPERPFVIYIIKIATNGEVLWEKQYSKDNTHFAAALDAQLGLDSCIYISGSTSKSEDSYVEYDEAFVLKINQEGTLIWDTILEKRKGIHLTLKRDTIVLLRRDNFSNYYIDYLSKEDGAVFFSYHFMDNDTNPSFFYTVDSLGNYYLLQDGPNYIIKKYAPNGENLWRYHKTENNWNQETIRAKQLVFDKNNNIYAIGTFDKDNLTNILLTKLDTEGNLLWEQEHEGFVYSGLVSNGVIVNKNQILVLGYKKEETDTEFLLLEYDTSGQLLQEINYSRGDSRAYSMFVENNSVYVMGETSQNEEKHLSFLKYTAPSKGTSPKPNLLNVVLYPNPTIGDAYLKGNEMANIKHIQIMNMLGQTMQDTQWQLLSDDLLKVDISYLLAGCYWLNVSNEKGDSIVLKLLKIGL